MNVGRVIGTALVGCLFFLFLALDLLLFGMVALESAVLTVLPVLGLVLGAVAGTVVSRAQHPH